MQSKLKELENSLADFIHQDEHSVLVIAVAEDELVYLYKIIESLDEKDRANVYGLFPQTATAPAAYADAIVANLREQLDPVSTLRAAEGRPPLPPLPDACTSPRTPPPERVRAAIEHARSLVPTERGNRLVWSLIPQTIPDRRGYAEILGGLLPRDGTPAWLKGVRLILRDDRAAPFVLPTLHRDRNPHVLTYAPDLSPTAMMDAMAREAADPGVGEGQRMQVIAQLAGLDYAHGRLQEAADKYAILYEYYTRHDVPEMRAFSLNGAGDVLRRLGRLQSARERYGQGLTVALGTQSLPLILNLSTAVGDTSMELKQYADAEDHWQVALKVARALNNVFVEADLLEKIGTARQALGRVSEAAHVWHEGADVSGKAGYHVRECSILERLVATYQGARMTDQQRQCEGRLRTARTTATRGTAPA